MPINSKIILEKRNGIKKTGIYAILSQNNAILLSELVAINMSAKFQVDKHKLIIKNNL